jgi:hypothetical protein
MEMQIKKEDEAEKWSTFASKGGQLATLFLMVYLHNLFTTHI